MSDAAAGIAIGVVVAALVLGSWLLSQSVILCKQSEAIIVERFGTYRRTLTGGLHFLLPFVDNPRSFTWKRTYVTVDGKIRDETTNSYRIDLREAAFDFQPQDCYTKDGVVATVDAVMYFRVTDPRRAIYETADLESAVMNTAQSALKRVIGNLTFSEALSSQETINLSMRQDLALSCERWGLLVERVELQDLRPKGTTASAMKQQMIAERSRRSEFILAEGNKAAMRLASEGAKIVKANIGIAEQESTRKRSEGDAAAKIELARAERLGLDTLAEALEGDGASQLDFQLARRYNDLLRAAPGSLEKRTVYLPYEAGGLTGIIGSLPGVYGQGQGQQGRQQGQAAVARRAGSQGPGGRAGAGAGSGKTTGAGAFSELD